MDHQRVLAKTLLQRQGRTYAEEAGIQLTDRPGPLYQLLVLTTLLSTRIRAQVAVATARELFRSGYRTPRRMAQASWQDRVDALGRAHYRRYDERTATMLGAAADLCRQRWNGDLRRLREESDGTVSTLRRLLVEFPGIGPTGADIFLREAQLVWTDLRPYADRRVIAGAGRLGLPTAPDRLARLVSAPDYARLAAALVRVSLRSRTAEEVARAAAGT